MKHTSIFALTLLAALPALAQNDLSWVSQRSGSDANNCLFTTPCQTFQGAYAKTASGGIIKAIDAGKYGVVSITQPITIDGNGVGASIDVITASTAGVFVNTPGPVEIRNLGIHAAPGLFNSYGIESSNSNVIVDNVSITGGANWGVSVTGGTATINAVTVTNAGQGILIQDATATITDSVTRYSSNVGIFVVGVSAVTQALIERSRIISSTNVGLVSNNEGAAATTRISDCVITGNTTGVSTFGGGQIITFRNNTWAGNTTDGTTPFSISQK
jgi:hypothetical protein